MKGTPRLGSASARERATTKPGGRESKWDFRLYIAGRTPTSLAVLAKIEKLCEAYLAGRCRIHVIDLLEQPQLARQDQIIAVPTLIRQRPTPVKMFIGNLPDMDRVATSLGLQNAPK